MTMGIGFTDRKVMAELTAKMLLEVEAVRFMDDKPFIFTSGWASPVYTDCRRLISFPRVRNTLMDFGAATVFRDVGFEQFDTVVGGETAGIPFAAWMADRLMLPMQYVRKKPKGFGRNAQIEGHLEPGQRVLLVEDLTTDGGSKINFCNALRTAGAVVEHIFVIFYYGIYPNSEKILSELNIKLHHLCTWWDVLEFAKSCGQFDPVKLSEIEKTMGEAGQFLGFEPPHFGAEATLGGCIASGLSGPRRPYAGAARDFVLGVRVLDGKGDDLRFGGRVMKNVAGFDVSRLMTGAMGTLGILLEVSLKCVPRPRGPSD